MNAVDILINLSIYQKLVNELHQHELAYLMAKDSGVKLHKRVSNAYDFITLELLLAERGRENLYLEVSFELESGAGVFKELYCSDPARTTALEKMVQATANTLPWQEKPHHKIYTNEAISNYLTIADTIASQAMNCASGDNYRPGSFSRISVSDASIVLSQINHMNSRSLDHKNDYSLRKLELLIPLTGMESNDSRYDYRIGEMLIEFSDHSSQNNLQCGKMIKAQIEKAKAEFKIEL